jgi:hypothetical protein
MLQHPCGQGTAARTVDLSEGGMRVRASRPLREGTRLRCRVNVVGTPWMVDGRVVWAERTPGRPCEGGIEFTGVAAKTWTGLRATAAVRHPDPSELDRRRLHVRRAPALAPIEAIPIALDARSAAATAPRPPSTRWWWLAVMALGVGAAWLAWAASGLGGATSSPETGHTPRTPAAMEALLAAPPDAGLPESGPIVDVAGDHTVVVLPLSGVPERVRHYALANPDGVAIDIWGAPPTFVEGHHQLDRGLVPSVTVRVGPARSHVRVFWSGGVPEYELDRRESVIELRIAH